jgi:transcriptional regulator with XRE-family HTH domain
MPPMPPDKKSKPAEPKAKVITDPLSPFVGEVLLHTRKKIGMKQKVAAKNAGMSDATLRKIEDGELPVSYEYLDKICPVLKVERDEILLEAGIRFCLSLIKTLGRNPNVLVSKLREEILENVDARHQAERRQIDAQLHWNSLLFFKGKFFIQD